MDDLSVEDLEALLESEHEALRNADFEGLERIMEQKEQVMDRLDELADELDTAAVERLRMMAAQNQRLQLATMDGLKAVIERLQSSQRVAQHLDTYDALGKRKDLAVPETTLEKRA